MSNYLKIVERFIDIKEVVLGCPFVWYIWGAPQEFFRIDLFGDFKRETSESFQGFVIKKIPLINADILSLGRFKILGLYSSISYYAGGEIHDVLQTISMLSKNRNNIEWNKLFSFATKANTLKIILVLLDILTLFHLIPLPENFSNYAKEFYHQEIVIPPNHYHKIGHFKKFEKKWNARISLSRQDVYKAIKNAQFGPNRETLTEEMLIAEYS